MNKQTSQYSFENVTKITPSNRKLNKTAMQKPGSELEYSCWLGMASVILNRAGPRLRARSRLAPSPARRQRSWAARTQKLPSVGSPPVHTHLQPTTSPQSQWKWGGKKGPDSLHPLGPWAKSRRDRSRVEWRDLRNSAVCLTNRSSGHMLRWHLVFIRGCGCGREGAAFNLPHPPRLTTLLPSQHSCLISTPRGRGGATSSLGRLSR